MRPILTRSEITGSVYITTKYKMLGSGELDTHEKLDVTREFDAIAGGIVAENAKLRDLVREMSLPYKYGECDCGLCPHVDECLDSETLEYNPDGCVILQMVHELGIEVD